MSDAQYYSLPDELLAALRAASTSEYARGFRAGIEAAASAVARIANGVPRSIESVRLLTLTADAIRALAAAPDAPPCAKCGGRMVEASHLKCQSCGRVAPTPMPAAPCAPDATTARSNVCCVEIENGGPEDCRQMCPGDADLWCPSCKRIRGAKGEP